MARKHLLSDLGGPKLPAGNSEDIAAQDVVTPQYSPRGAIGAVSRSIELLKSQSLTELDPDLIDAPLVADRLEESPEQFEEFARNIKEHGQQVPILVRPHPSLEGRYQIAYGRRRLRAVKAAGIQVKAAVRTLSDDELVLAQGQENSARQDLSFIERALYAAELEAGGFQRPVIMDCDLPYEEWIAVMAVGQSLFPLASNRLLRSLATDHYDDAVRYNALQLLDGAGELDTDFVNGLLETERDLDVLELLESACL